MGEIETEVVKMSAVWPTFWVVLLGVIAAIAAIFFARFGVIKTIKSDRDIARKAKTLEFIIQVENSDLHELGTAAIALYSNDHGASIGELGTKLSVLTKQRDGEEDNAGKKRGENAVAVYAFLNHYEYMAGGVRHNIICEDILRNANYSTVISLVKNTKPFIEQVRKRKDSNTIFEAVEWMANRWETAGYSGKLPSIE